MVQQNIIRKEKKKHERNILLRFSPKDDLILLVDKVAEKLSLTNASLTKISLQKFCEESLNGKSTN